MGSLMKKDNVILERHFVPAGRVLMREGEVGNSAYLIQSGRVSVYRETGESASEITQLGPGDIFGEMALIIDEPRTASVKALDECNLIIITRGTLEAKLKRSDPTVRALIKILTHRVKTMTAMASRDMNLDVLETTLSQAADISDAGMTSVQKAQLRSEIMPRLNALQDALKKFRKAHFI